MKTIILKFIQFFLKQPLKKIPKKYLKEFTLDWKVWVKDMYINEVKPNFLVRKYTEIQKENNFELIKNNKWWNYPSTDLLLFKALEKYKIENKTVAIMWSQTPWYESVSLYYWWLPTTIEYWKIISQIKWLKTVKYLDFKKNITEFDVAFSISSFEHDGLWRYWDPINPNWDLEAMKNMKKIVKKWWLMFFSVPIWKDCIVWNAHRIYWKIRLNMLFEWWKLVESFWYEEKMLDIDTIDSNNQPIFILKNN